MTEIFYNNFKIKNVSRTFPKYRKYAAHFYFFVGKTFLEFISIKKIYNNKNHSKIIKK